MNNVPYRIPIVIYKYISTLPLNLYNYENKNKFQKPYQFEHSRSYNQKKMDKQFFLMTKYGAIPLNDFVTKIGRLRCHLKLHSAECSSWHGSIIIRADRKIKLINHSTSKHIFINDIKINPNESSYLEIGDVISFSGVETFKLVNEAPVVELSVVELTPD